MQALKKKEKHKLSKHTYHQFIHLKKSLNRWMWWKWCHLLLAIKCMKNDALWTMQQCVPVGRCGIAIPLDNSRGPSQDTANGSWVTAALLELLGGGPPLHSTRASLCHLKWYCKKVECLMNNKIHLSTVRHTTLIVIIGSITLQLWAEQIQKQSQTYSYTYQITVENCYIKQWDRDGAWNNNRVIKPLETFTLDL